MELTLVRHGGPGGTDVVVRAARGTTLAGLRPALLGACGAPDDAALVLGDGALPPPGAVLGAPPLVHGAVLVAVPASAGASGNGAATAAGAGATARPRPVALLRLLVTGGPDAGGVVPIAPGRHGIGRGAGAAVRLDDDRVSRAHAEVDVSPLGVRVRDLGSANGTRLDGRSVGGEWVELTPASQLRVGASALALVGPPAGRAAASPAGRPPGDGTVVVTRRRRVAPPPRDLDVVLPAPAPHPPRPALALLPLLLPVVVAVPLALLWSPLALLLALGGPVTTLGTLASERRRTGRRRRRVRRDHAAAVRGALRRARALEAEVVADLEREHPDPATLLVSAQQLGDHLWRRTAAETGALVVRVGTAARASGVRVVRAGPPGRGADGSSGRPSGRALTAPAVPVVLDLAATGVLGVAGAGADRLARSLVGQAAVLLGPDDLVVVVLRAGAAPGLPAARPAGQDGAWSWTTWLPQAADGGVASSPADVEELARAVLDLLPPAGSTGGGVRRRVLVVLDGAASLRRAPVVAALLAAASVADRGLAVVAVEDDAGALPAECAVVAVVAGGGDDAAPPTVHLRGARAPRTTGPVLADLVGDHWGPRLGRALAPLRPAPGGSAGAGASAAVLPRAVRLLDLLAAAGACERGSPEADGSGPVSAASSDQDAPVPFDPLDPAHLAARWSRAPRSAVAVLGAGARGRWEVDLRRDGPHVLVAGTTGSGKSELLASLVLSLAAVNAPAELAVVLVDYKGGAAFAPLAGLPHAVGLLTDLDVPLARRVLASLRAEVRRRERVLREARCADLDALLARAAAEGPGAAHLGRLLVVVDEFRVLSEEVPDVVDGLVRLAAVGRSMGIHLVLATQRPAGVVTPDIRANTNLRVALRVREELESVDVVAAPDAAAISSADPGRAVVRTGGGPLEVVQVARASGAAPPPVGEPSVRARQVGPRARGLVLDGRAAGRTGGGGGDDPGRGDDLALLVAALTTAAAGWPRPSRPWLPALPQAVGLAAIERDHPDGGGLRGAGGAGVDGDELGGLLVGLLDEPADQRQRPARWEASAPLAVVGPPRSGRTGVLRVLAAGVARRRGDRWQLAVVQQPGGGLDELSALPHCWGVASTADGEHVVRLLRHLSALVVARGASAGGDRSGLRGATAGGGATRARIVVLVDDADRLLEAGSAPGLGGPEAHEAAALLLQLLLDGPAADVVVVLAGGRPLTAGRTGAVVRDRLLLALDDPADAALLGVPASAVPATAGAGRGLVTSPQLREVQVALLDTGPVGGGPDASAQAQRAALAGVVRDAVDRERARAGGRAGAGGAAGPGAPRVPPLPLRLGREELGRRSEQRWGAAGGSTSGRRPGPQADPALVPVGVGGVHAEVVDLDLAATPLVCVAGAAGSGRTSALEAVGRHVHARGGRVHVVAARVNALVVWARGAGVPVDLLGDRPTGVLRPGRARSADPLDPDHPVDPDHPATTVLVDDVDLLTGPEGDELTAALVEHAHRAAGSAASAGTGGRPGGALVVAGTGSDLAGAFRGVVPLVRRARTGLLLHPVTPAECDLLGVRVPRTSPGPPGRATLVRGGSTTTVQLAAP